MDLIYVDYSPEYFSGISQRLPDRIEGKFVQILHNTDEFLIFAPKGSLKYHADIVSRFCSDRNISGIYNNARKSFDIVDVEWAVRGGGKFRLDRTRKKILLYDNSMAYGKFDADGLKEKILSIAEFSDYEVRIEE